MLRSECLDPPSWLRHYLEMLSASRPCRFVQRIKASDTHWRGGWVDPRAGLDHIEERKLLTLPGFELRLLSRPACRQSLYRLRYCGYAWFSLSKRQPSQLSLLFIAYNHSSLHGYRVLAPLHTQIRASVCGYKCFCIHWPEFWNWLSPLVTPKGKWTV
jgi:hypothetical protein